MRVLISMPFGNNIRYSVIEESCKLATQVRFLAAYDSVDAVRALIYKGNISYLSKCIEGCEGDGVVGNTDSLETLRSYVRVDHYMIFRNAIWHIMIQDKIVPAAFIGMYYNERRR